MAQFVECVTVLVVSTSTVSSSQMESARPMTSKPGPEIHELRVEVTQDVDRPMFADEHGTSVMCQLRVTSSRGPSEPLTNADHICFRRAHQFGMRNRMSREMQTRSHFMTVEEAAAKTAWRGIAGPCLDREKKFIFCYEVKLPHTRRLFVLSRGDKADYHS